jgi:hypothetical protein
MSCFKSPRPINRNDGAYRDSCLFVIATEDKDAPKQYFDKHFRHPRIHVEVLPTVDCRSAPEHVLKRLDEYKETYQLGKDDEFWLMLDTDHWIKAGHIQNFTRVCKESIQKNCQLAHSNPCFEIWLLLHISEIGDTQLKNYREIVRHLTITPRKHNNKNCISVTFSKEEIAVAVARAEKLDKSPADRWPQKTGSHVYKIVKRLLAI